MRKRSTWVAGAMLAVFGAGLIFNVALAVANNSVARDPAGVLYLLDFTAFMVVGAHCGPSSRQPHGVAVFSRWPVGPSPSRWPMSTPSTPL